MVLKKIQRAGSDLWHMYGSQITTILSTTILSTTFFSGMQSPW
jgi:hypothetical protein